MKAPTKNLLPNILGKIVINESYKLSMDRVIIAETRSMRYFDFTLIPEDGSLHPVDEVIAAQPDVTRESLLHLNSLGDGTGVLLYRLRGDCDRIDEVLSGLNKVISLDLLEEGCDVFYLYLHIKPGEPAGQLMGIAQRHALIIEPPLVFTERGGIRTTIVGQHEMLRQALEEFPDEIQISIEQVGRYSPEQPPILSILTERQIEVFQMAVEKGYYEIPRRATHEDIAADLGCAPSTIDEHLRKAEARVLPSLVK